VNHESRPKAAVSANQTDGVIHSRTSNVGLKWAVLILFVIGYAATAGRFGSFGINYLLYNLVALCACALLLSLLEFDRRCASVWLGLIVLLTVYFVRFYWIAIDSSPLSSVMPYDPYRNMNGLMPRRQALEAFRLSVIAFVSFSLSSAALLALLKSSGSESNIFPTQEGEEKLTLHQFAPKLILLILLPLMLVLAYLALRFQIGQMGIAPGEPLPFRLKGVIAYARIVMMPLLILQVICSGERSGQRALVWIGILLLLAHGVSDMLIRSSRSGLLLSVLLLAFVVMAGGLELRRKVVGLVGAIGAFAIVLIPGLTIYRGLRARHDDMPMTEALAGAFSSMSNAWLSEIIKGIEFVFFRIPGVELLWAIVNRDVEPLGLRSFEIFSSQNGMVGYLTYNVYRLDLTEITLFAPGFAGWLYLVGGVPAIVVGSVLIVILSVLGWKYLSHERWLCGPVARTFLLWIIFMALAEGTLDAMGFTVFVGVLTIVALESGLRIFRKFLERRNKLKNSG